MVDLSDLQNPVKAGIGQAARSRAKLMFDRAAALVALCLLSPLLLAVAVMIRIDSPGRALFSQTRHGCDGRTFRIYKFRTMTADASRKPFRQAVAGDARITRLGHMLRNSSIDELPQLFNVVRGDMALVGPRPHPLALDEHFRGLIPNYMQRYCVRPGITGLAQTSGHRGPTPTVEAMAERVQLDLHYIDNWSFRMDIAILLRTVLHLREYGRGG